MNRSEWLKIKQKAAEERYDRLWAPIYDENWGGAINAIHERLVTQIVSTCPLDGLILDAACGTGKYWPILQNSGRAFCGIDQSQGMLEHAAHKFPQVKVKKISLQEMRYSNAFDLILCMDAMEMVFPEDWPRVLANFCRALKVDGQLYITVEIADPIDVEKDYQAGIGLGLPLVFGEAVFADEKRAEEAGYHFYPTMDQVRQWLKDANFAIKEEDEGDDYHHFWVVRV